MATLPSAYADALASLLAVKDTFKDFLAPLLRAKIARVCHAADYFKVSPADIVDASLENSSLMAIYNDPRYIAATAGDFRASSRAHSGVVLSFALRMWYPQWRRRFWYLNVPRDSGRYRFEYSVVSILTFLYHMKFGVDECYLKPSWQSTLLRELLHPNRNPALPSESVHPDYYSLELRFYIMQLGPAWVIHSNDAPFSLRGILNMFTDKMRFRLLAIRSFTLTYRHIEQDTSDTDSDADTDVPEFDDIPR